MVKKKKPKVDKYPDAEKFDYIKTVKGKADGVIKKEHLLHINNMAILINKFVIHAYMFIKLYFLFLYKHNLVLPKITEDFIKNVFAVISIRNEKRGQTAEVDYSTQLGQLYSFFEHYYKPLMNGEVLVYDKLSYSLAYEATDMLTNIENNIKEHFHTHLNKFVNHTFNLQGRKDYISSRYKKNKELRKEKYQQLNEEFKLIKDDLLLLPQTEVGQNTPFKSNPIYHKWIQEQRRFIIPNKEKFDEDSVYYDIKSNCQDYLNSLMYIGKQLEKLNDYNGEIDDPQARLFNLLPLRSSLVIKNFQIDTCSIIQNFVKDEKTKPLYDNYKKKPEIRERLWNMVFNLNHPIFKSFQPKKNSKLKPKYAFRYSVKTDGVAISILFTRLDANGVPLEKHKDENKPIDNPVYIENTIITDEMRTKRKVTIDLNMADLAFCGSYNQDGELDTFRYTQNQRRLETRSKKYRNIIQAINTNTIFGSIDGINNTVKQIESKLSNYSKKTFDFDRFTDYIIQKNIINQLLYKHYEQCIFRKLRLNSYTNTKKSESKMIRNFRIKFGGPKDVIVFLGDFDKGNHHMAGVEPVICKKFRKLFRKAGYEVYLLNEHKTSCICSKCHQELDKFLYRESKKPKDKVKMPDGSYKGKRILVNGLLRHEDVKQKCESIHNRDTNAVKNMLFIVNAIFNSATEETNFIGKRPELFTRKKKEKTT